MKAVSTSLASLEQVQGVYEHGQTDWPTRRGLLLILLLEVQLASNSIASQSWSLTSAPNTNWIAVASSADGRNLLASVDGGCIYVSTNSGASWTVTTAPATNWQSVATAADGSRLAAINRFAPFISPDGGRNWTQSSGPEGSEGSSITSSGDGQVLATVAIFPDLRVSTNGGLTWSQDIAPGGDIDQRMLVIASSADGRRHAVAVDDLDFGISNLISYSSYVFVMTNLDTTTPFGGQGALYNQFNFGGFTSLACSTNGMRLVAFLAYPFSDSLPGTIYFSSDAGLSWTSNGVPTGITAWTSLSGSADLTRLAVATWGAGICVSTNSGRTWTVTAAPTKNWISVASSADGCRVVAAVAGGGIYTWQTPPTPVINARVASTNLLLSWTIPSSDFALWQSSDLSNWQKLSASVTLDFSELNAQVVLPLGSAPAFYRLATR